MFISWSLGRDDLATLLLRNNRILASYKHLDRRAHTAAVLPMNYKQHKNITIRLELFLVTNDLLI